MSDAPAPQPPFPGTDIKLVIVEYWSVPAENLERWRYFFEKIFLGAFTHTHGYSGSMVQERSGHGIDIGIGFAEGEQRRVIAPHPWLQHAGVRTNTMIDFDALLQHEYNIVAMHYFHDLEGYATHMGEWVAGYEKIQPNWREEHPDAETLGDAIFQDFFALADNHWDVFYDVTSLQWHTGVKAGPVPPPPR